MQALLLALERPLPDDGLVETTPTPALSSRRLLLVCVLFPALIAGATYLVLALVGSANPSVMESTVGFGFFIIEVGLVGLVVGHAMPQPLYRWLLFGWIMLLINLLTGSLAMGSADDFVSQILPAAALVAAQIGLAIIGGVLGTGRWYWRAILLAGLGPALLGMWVFWITGWSGRLVGELLVIQSCALTLICVALRISGYRLMPQQPASEVVTPGNRRLQFGVRDVLVWTTVLAILLALMRAAGMLRLESLQKHPSLFLKCTIAVLSAMAIVVALWAALGRGHVVLRYGLLFVTLLALGSAMGAWCKHGDWLLGTLLGSQPGLQGPGRQYWDWDLYQWHEVGWWWIAWMFLSGGLLAASLLIFRVIGYRLVRERGTSSAART